MNQLYVGIDVGSAKNAAYLMMPDGSKHSSFSVQNNLGGAKMLTERIVSALTTKDLSSVTIGLEATSVYGDTLVYALREDGRLGHFERKLHEEYRLWHFTSALERENIGSKNVLWAKVLMKNPLFLDEPVFTKELDAQAEKVLKQYAVGRLITLGDVRYLSGDLLRFLHLLVREKSTAPPRCS